MNVLATCLPHPTESGSWLLFVELGVGAAESSPAAARRPVHLVLALDASSSMGGPRLACAVAAAHALVERLGGEDLFGLLAFDRGVRTLFGPGKVNEGARALLHDALGSLKPGLGTALHSAVVRSHEALRRVFVREARPRAIVLTDGFPSVGPREPEEFESLSRAAASEGIVTSAVGVGLDFDEQCVAAIAAGGGGRYSFVDQEADIPGALGLHLRDLFAVAVDDVTVELAPAPTIREAMLLHRYPTRIGPQGFVVETGPVGRDNPRRLLFVLRADGEPGPVAARIRLLPKGAPAEAASTVAVPVEPLGVAALEAMREYHRLALAQSEAEFWAEVHASERSGAARALAAAEAALEALATAGASEREIETCRRRMLDGHAVLDGRLDDEAREAARKRAHQSQIARLTSIGEVDGS